MPIYLTKFIFPFALISAGLLLLSFLVIGYSAHIIEADITKRELLVDRTSFPDGDYKVKGVTRNIHYEFETDDGKYHEGKKHVTYWAWEKYRDESIIQISYFPLELRSAPPVIVQLLRFILGVVLIAAGVILHNSSKKQP